MERGSEPGTWLLPASHDSAEVLFLVRVGASAVDGVITLAGAASESGLVSPARLHRIADGGYVFGSGREPSVLRLTRSGAVLWRASLSIPPVPDPLPSSAPYPLRRAPFRVSSAIELRDGRIITTLFRPGRRHTIVALLSSSGEQLETVVYPVPLWFFGRAHGDLLLGARIQSHPEVVVYAMR